MCNNNNNNNNSCNCLRDILKIILILQKNVNPERERGLDTCDKKFLGSPCECEFCNTRPVTLYTAESNGVTPWRMPISKDPNETTLSSVFRIEKIDECCCTFRVLKFKHKDCHEELEDCCFEEEFEATDSFFTININCFCCIKCLEDTFVACV